MFEASLGSMRLSQSNIHPSTPVLLPEPESMKSYGTNGDAQDNFSTRTAVLTMFQKPSVYRNNVSLTKMPASFCFRIYSSKVNVIRQEDSNHEQE